jgi:phosphate-selective porin
MKKIILIILISLIGLPNIGFSQGCMGSDSEDGVKVVGYIQGQYEYQFLGEDVEPIRGLNSNNSFYFNRARLGVVGNIPYDFSYYVMAELSPTKHGPYLLDAFIAYKRFDPYLTVSLGQFKSPFGLELTTPCQSLHVVDRSRFVGELASPYRDLGIMFLGSTGELFGKKDLISYRFAITNGTGMNKMDDNEYKDYIGRIIISPLEWLHIGASYKYGKQKPVKADMDPDERTRWGVDLSLEKANVIFQTEYIQGLDKGSSLVGGGCGSTPTIVLGDFKRNGYMAQLLYMTPWNIQPVVKFESYDPNIKIGDGNPDDTEHEYDYDKQQDFIFGFNYFFNEWTRLQANYVYKTEESGDTEDTYHEVANDYFVIQLQVQF